MSYDGAADDDGDEDDDDADDAAGDDDDDDDDYDDDDDDNGDFDGDDEYDDGYDDGDGDDFWDDDENERFNTQKTAPVQLVNELSRTRDIESSKDYLLQLDFVNPINENSTFEVGLRGETRIITSDYKAENFDGTDWDIFNGIENKLDYKEEIGGVYAQFSSKVSKSFTAVNF